MARRPASAKVDGDGTVSSIASTSCGELPQVICGFSLVQSMSITRSYSATDVIVQRAPRGDRLIPQRALRHHRPAVQILERRVVGGDEAAARAELDRHVADRQAAFERHGADRRSTVLHDVPDSGIDTVAADQCQDHVLGVDALARRAMELGAQRAGLAHDQRLGGEHLHHLGGADAPGPCADSAAARGMAVATDVGAARQRESKMRADHVDDSVVGVVDAEQA